MTRIDCAQNNELAEELTKFLHQRNYTTVQENKLLTVGEKLPKSLLELFLKETNRSKHRVTLVEPDSFLIAIPVNMEEIGLESCEFCGYTSHHSLVEVHRRTHQGL